MLDKKKCREVREIIIVKGKQKEEYNLNLYFMSFEIIGNFLCKQHFNIIQVKGK